MSALKSATFWKKNDERPPVVEKMADYFSERGWILWEEWIDPWYDEEEKEEYEGHWSYRLVREELFDGKLHVWNMFPICPSHFPEIWDHEIKLAEVVFQRYKEENGLI